MDGVLKALLAVSFHLLGYVDLNERCYRFVLTILLLNQLINIKYERNLVFIFVSLESFYIN